MLNLKVSLFQRRWKTPWNFPFHLPFSLAPRFFVVKQLDYVIFYLQEMLRGNYANVASLAILAEIKVQFPFSGSEDTLLKQSLLLHSVGDFIKSHINFVLYQSSEDNLMVLLWMDFCSRFTSLKYSSFLIDSFRCSQMNRGVSCLCSVQILCSPSCCRWSCLPG